MKRVILITLLFLIAASSWTAAQPEGNTQSETQYAVGVVFHDANLNGIRDQGEKGLPGVRVSNGREVVKTDQSGDYKLPVDDDTIIFVIKPRNWRPIIDENNVPRFYYIHKPNGSPKLKQKGVDPTGPLPASVDFPLYPNPEPDKFKAIFLGDTQVASEKEIGYLAHDIIEEIVGTDAAFAVSLGDIVYDNLALFEPILPVMGKMGIPCYYVKGNHDTNYDAIPNQRLVDETYERYLGPSYYSFDYGPVHFVTLNNPYFANFPKYVGHLDPDQMTFLQNDIRETPKDQLVVLMMHIPIFEMLDRKEIYKLIDQHDNSFSISGHWHVQHHVFIEPGKEWNGTKAHHHFVNGTSCGSWWKGWPDEVGIPHTTMRDGAPNGYSIITFDKNNYSIVFKAARRPADYQMNIYSPDIVDLAKVGETEILANIFVGSPRSKVEMRLQENDPWIQMKRVEVEDPAFVRSKELEDSADVMKSLRMPAGASKSTHMWKAKLPEDAAPGTYLLQVRTTDMFDQTYIGNRIITIR